MLGSIRCYLMEPSLVNGQIKAGPCGCALRSLDLAIACGYPLPHQNELFEAKQHHEQKKAWAVFGVLVRLGKCREIFGDKE